MCVFMTYRSTEHKMKTNIPRDITKMLDFLIDNIFVQFVGRVFQQTIDISMGTNCARFLADLFLQALQADFLQELRKLVQTFNISFRFGNYLHLIYPNQLDIKDTTDPT